MEGELKVCNSCLEGKPVREFPSSKEGRGGLMAICRVCKNAKQRQYRKSNSDSCTKRYEKTAKGYIMRTYNNMIGRVKGRVKPHLYKGLDLLAKDEFYSWSLDNPGFNNLFTEYTNSNYDMKLAPSIDRRDTSLGYTLDNIRWITHSENSRIGSAGRSAKGPLEILNVNS